MSLSKRPGIHLFFYLALIWLPGIWVSCLWNQEKQPDSFSFPKLADSLKQYDSVHIILKDAQGKTIDVLFKDSVKSASDLENLEAPHFKGGKAIISVVGFKDGRIDYQVDRIYDANRRILENLVPYVVPGSSLKLDSRELSIPIKKTLPFPSVAVEPKELVSKVVRWTSLQEKVVRVDENGLTGLLLGGASIVVSLVSDTTKKDTLRVTVSARPSLPETIRILPDTLTLAAGGRAGA
jgi:hypothetical protein